MFYIFKFKDFLTFVFCIKCSEIDFGNTIDVDYFNCIEEHEKTTEFYEKFSLFDDSLNISVNDKEIEAKETPYYKKITIYL